MNSNDCLFCTIDKERILFESELAYVIYDGYPVTEYHSLIIPKRHAITYFDLTHEEREDCHKLLEQTKEHIEHHDNTVTGFNIGMNCNESAGQTIFHCHIHLIPRRDGDVSNPKGGVRGVIPNKQNY